MARLPQAPLGVAGALGRLRACVLVCVSSLAQAGKGQAPSLTCVCVLWPHWPRATSPAPVGALARAAVRVRVCWGTLGFSPRPTGSTSSSLSCRVFREAPFCCLSSHPCWKESVSIRSIDAPILNETANEARCCLRSDLPCGAEPGRGHRGEHPPSSDRPTLVLSPQLRGPGREVGSRGALGTLLGFQAWVPGWPGALVGAGR